MCHHHVKQRLQHKMNRFIVIQCLVTCFACLSILLNHHPILLHPLESTIPKLRMYIFCNLLKYLRAVCCEYSIFYLIFRQNNVLPTTTTTKATTKSLLNTGMEFSREFWLRNSQNAAYN